MTKKPSVSRKGINPSSHFIEVTKLTKYQQKSANGLLVDYSNKIRHCTYHSGTVLFIGLFNLRKEINSFP